MAVQLDALPRGSDGGQALASDAAAAQCLAKGNPKAKVVKPAWGMTDQNAAGEKLTGR